MNIHAEKPETDAIRLSHIFHVPAERLFDAWTDPSLVVQWFGSSGFTLADATIDLKVGGAYRFRMQPADGDAYYHWGEYKVIDRPRKLVFTWILQNQACGAGESPEAETLVTLDFVAMGARTELIVTHEGLPTEKAREGHTSGWTGCLESLGRFFD